MSRLSPDQINSETKTRVRDPAKNYEWLKAFTSQHGYELLEKEWLGSAVEHRFRRSETGDEYLWCPGALKHANGFPKNPDKLNFEKSYQWLKAFAAQHGYELLEKEWRGGDSKHRFRRVETGEEYCFIPRELKFNNQFPKNPDRLNFEKSYQWLKAFGAQHGYELLEKEWLGDGVNHRFRHIETGDEYEVRPAKLKTMNGFPLLQGQKFFTQEVCRQAFAHIFGGEFNTNRERLKARNGGQAMELDGYEEFEGVPNPLKKVAIYKDKEGAEVAFNLPIAFEFQGHQNHQECVKTITRDRLKAKFCEEEGILLVRIEPTDKGFWKKIRDADFMYAYVCNAIQSAVGLHEMIEFPSGFDLDLSNWNYDREQYERLQDLSKENGYELVSSKWLGIDVKHQFRHIVSGEEYWWVPYQLMTQGFPKNPDPKNPARSYQWMKAFAAQHGYELLEKEWLGSNAIHRFRHLETRDEYKARPHNLKTLGFPKNPNKLNFEKSYKWLKELAELSGYELLTPEWRGNGKSHRFKYIATGDEYEWIPDNLKRRGFPTIPTIRNRAKSLREHPEEAATRIADQMQSHMAQMPPEFDVEEAPAVEVDRPRVRA